MLMSCLAVPCLLLSSLTQRVRGSRPASAVLLAADAWAQGEKAKALSEWDYACEAITTGCQKYKSVEDGGWLVEVRRWPPNLVEAQRNFLAKK